MKGSYGLLRFCLVVFSLANIVLGAVAFSGDRAVVRMAASFYGAEVLLTPQLIHVIRMLGAFVFAIGIMAALAITDPERNVHIIDGIIILLLLRVLQRVLYAGQITAFFGISDSRNWMNVGFFLIIAFLFALLRPKEKSS
jgi:hypothetical protein